jgi:hypothetical protein
MKNSNDTIGNRPRDLLACSAVPQSTATPRAPNHYQDEYKNYQKCSHVVDQPHNSQILAETRR